MSSYIHIYNIKTFRLIPYVIHKGLQVISNKEVKLNMSSKLVFIKSIPRQTATGVSEWVSDVSGKRLNKTKIGRAVDKLQA